MPLDIRIQTDDGYLLELDNSSVYGIPFDSGGFGIPQAGPVFAEVFGNDGHPLVGVDYGNREAELGLFIRSTTLDGWITNHQQLQRALYRTQRWWASQGDEGAAAQLSVQLNGMTYPVEWDIVRGEIITDPALLGFPIKSTTAPLARVGLRLTIRPWSHPQALIRSTSGTLNNGGGTGATAESYTVSAPAGDVPCPVKITFQTLAGDDFRRVVIGKKSGTTVSNFIFPLQCEEGTFTGYVVAQVTADPSLTLAPAAVAAASNGNVGRLTATLSGVVNETLWTWTINTNLLDWRGRYRAYLRLDDGSPDVSETVRLTYGGTAGTDIALDNVTIPNAGDVLLDMGIVEIPARSTPVDVVNPSFVMALQYTGNGFSEIIDFDCLYLVPIDEGYANMLLSAAASAQDQLVIDGLSPRPSTYLKDSTGDLQPETITERPNTYFWLEPGVDNRFFVLFSDGAADDWTDNIAHDLTDQYTITLEYPAYYFLFRTS